MGTDKEVVILISSVPYRDSDLIVNLLSVDHGKLSAVIHRGRVIGKESSFSYHPGDLIEIEYTTHEARDFIKIQNVHPRKLISPDKFTYQRFIFHSYLLEIIARISKPSMPCDDLFDLISQNNLIDWASSDPFYIIGWSIWRLIKHSGFEIDFSICQTCGQQTWKISENGDTKFRKQEYRILNSSGGLLCMNCSGSINEVDILSAPMIKLLWLFEEERYSFEKGVVPEIISRPLILALNRYLLHHYEISPKSLGLFEKIIHPKI